jgi:hypothetical protein
MIGRAPANNLVLTAGPNHFGTIPFTVENGRITSTLAANADVLADGAPSAHAMELSLGWPTHWAVSRQNTDLLLNQTDRC